MSMKRLAACLMNVSEGRNKTIIETVASAAANANDDISGDSLDGLTVPSTVLNIFTDYDYNRSVITIAAHVDYLAKCVIAASKVAAQQINMTTHDGIHPRLGAVDLIPVYPLSTAVSVEECGNIAKDIASKLVKSIPGFSCFLFGSAHKEMKSLVERRKEVGWFKGQTSFDCGSVISDLGSKSSQMLGITGIGASNYVMNCNVTIKTQDLQVGRRIAKAIRGTSPGGLKGVQSMAFPHRGNIEVACNVESYSSSTESERLVGISDQSKEKFVGDSSGTVEGHSKKWIYTSPQRIEQRVRELAMRDNIEMVGTALIGFSPEQAYDLTVQSLRKGDRERWKLQIAEHM